jgi:hypothetical protein
MVIRYFCSARVIKLTVVILTMVIGNALLWVQPAVAVAPHPSLCGADDVFRVIWMYDGTKWECRPDGDGFRWFEITPPSLPQTDPSNVLANAVVYPNATFDSSSWYVRVSPSAALSAPPGEPWEIRVRVISSSNQVIYSGTHNCASGAATCFYDDTWAAPLALYDSAEVYVGVGLQASPTSTYASTPSSVQGSCD